MAEHTTIVTVTYKILGETTEYSLDFPVTADADTPVREIMGQVARAAESDRTLDILGKLGMDLIKHMAKNTKDPE